MNDTIVAQSTPYGRSGVGILRISGIRTKDIAYSILGLLPSPRYAHYTTFFDDHSIAIDEGLAIWFPKPNSFTGEDVLELHAHGNPIILNMLIKSIVRFKNVRIAHPGEFSKRAFLNGKLDLIQAESIITLINATSNASAKSALQSLQGTFSIKINNLIYSVKQVRTLIETILNFPEDDYLIHNKQIDEKLNSIFKNIYGIDEIIKLQHIINDGIKIVISGQPNVGKSTIFNLLSCKNSAIVTNIAGTTRDVLHEYVNIKGSTVQLIDTAGFRKTNNIIENIGIDKAWEQIVSSDHIFFVIDNQQTILQQKTIISNFINKINYKKKITILINKCDLTHRKPIIKEYRNGHTYIILSAKTGSGINLLKLHLEKLVSRLTDFHTETVFLARQRHVNIFNLVNKKIKNIKKNWFYLKNFELLAEDLKEIQDMLNNITGSVTSDDILKSIFQEFCIGK